MGSILPKIVGGFRYKRGSASKSKSKTPKKRLSFRSNRKSVYKKGGKKGKGSKRRTKKAGCGN